MNMYIYTEFKSLTIFFKKNQGHCIALYCMQICASHILPQNTFFYLSISQMHGGHVKKTTSRHCFLCTHIHSNWSILVLSATETKSWNATATYSATYEDGDNHYGYQNWRPSTKRIIMSHVYHNQLINDICLMYLKFTSC